MFVLVISILSILAQAALLYISVLIAAHCTYTLTAKIKGVSHVI